MIEKTLQNRVGERARASLGVKFVYFSFSSSQNTLSKLHKFVSNINIVQIFKYHIKILKEYLTDVKRSKLGP